MSEAKLLSLFANYSDYVTVAEMVIPLYNTGGHVWLNFKVADA